jgi:hypothetical protein
LNNCHTVGIKSRELAETEATARDEALKKPVGRQRGSKN